MSQLKYKTEFEKLLKTYQPSTEVIDQARKLNLVLFVGISSSGRNTIIRELIKKYGHYFIVSDTTRPPRVNDGVEEAHGEHYNFKSEEDFLEGLKKGEYLEFAVVHHQQVSGVSLDELKKAKLFGKTCMTDIDIVGTKSILRLVPSAKAIFVIPPSFDIWMKRLTDRGELDQEEIMRRLASAEKELEEAISRDDFHIIINDNLDDAVEEAQAIIMGKQDLNQASERAVQEIAWRLLNEVKQEVHS